MPFNIVVAVVAGMMLGAVDCYARIGADLTASQMAERADVIIKGQVLEVRDLGKAKFRTDALRPGKREFLLNKAGASIHVARIRVDRILKGKVDSDVVDLKHYWAPSASLMVFFQPGENVLLFLKTGDDGLSLLDLDNGKLPASKRQSPMKGQAVDSRNALMDELGLLVDDQDEKLIKAGLDGLASLGETESRRVLARFSQNANVSIKATAISGLIRSGDAEAVNEMVRTLQGERLNVERVSGKEQKEARSAFLGAMIYLPRQKDPRIAKFLLPLMDHKDQGVRRSAIVVLRQLKSPDSIPAMVKLLDDPDRDNQYMGVITLCDLIVPGGTGCPGIDAFKSNPDKFIAKWKAWWKERQEKKP